MGKDIIQFTGDRDCVHNYSGPYTILAMFSIYLIKCKTSSIMQNNTLKVTCSNEPLTNKNYDFFIDAYNLFYFII